MCIYFTDRTGLHYQTREHIIPAAIGGINMLQRGVVSDEFNREIAELERGYMRDSMYAGFARVLQGPGVRGSLLADKQVRSKVEVLIRQELTTDLMLGYVRKGILHTLPQIHYQITTKASSVHFPDIPGSDTETNIKLLKDVCREIRHVKTTEILSEVVPMDTFLFGYLREAKRPKTYFARHPRAEFQFDSALVEPFAHHLTLKPESTTKSPFNAIVNAKHDFQIEYHRLHAKIAFNYLAHFWGQDFVMHTCFNPIRSWIANGGENDFVGLYQNKSAAIQRIVQCLPEQAHAIVICHQGFQIVAYVILYGFWVSFIELTKNAPNRLYDDLYGIVCDWKNRQEFDLSRLRSR